MTDVETIARIEPGPEAARLATSQYDRLLAELQALDPDQWQATTVCAPWTVADTVRHLVGAAEGHASMRESMRQIRYGMRHKDDFGGNSMDAMNELQVADHADLGPAELLEALAEVAPRAVAKRMKLPKPMRRLTMANAPGGSTAEGMPEKLSLGQLFTVILTRDVFIHRLDVARATGGELSLDAETEGRIVADVVAEWAGRHDEPVRLELTGPAGGSYTAGDGGPHLELDAAEFCWILSGRAPAPHPLLETRVLF